MRPIDRCKPIIRAAMMAACLASSGCVIGYGPCLFQQPFKNHLTGRVHFRDFPGADGIDNVPVLVPDRTAYVYAAQSFHCLPANDLQLTGVAEFPQNIIENSHVSVDGVVFQSASGREHTTFVMKVTTILPVAASR